ncbi:NAD-binding protein [candidate division KSB1 bacterium]|nr:NAD-binding protein [candidate division KSB1 bacterium]
MKAYTQAIKRTLKRTPTIYLLSFLVIFFLVSVVIIHAYEKEKIPDLSYFDAFRIVLVFFFGEYGDTPKTSVGQVLSIMLFLLGILVVASIIGKIASIFVNMKLEVKMPRETEQHIVMCNWNSSADRIIKEIHSPLASPETEIIVISESDINEQQLRLSPEYEKVYFIKSDPTLHEVLKSARAQFAKSVIILADRHCSDPDAKTALIALAITKLERDLPQKPHIIAEVMNHRKIHHLIDAGVDEWICATDYALGIISQSALFGKLSEVYQQLLTYSRETNEIYLVEGERYPPDFIGKSFDEISSILNTHRNPQNPVILLGIKRDDQIILNPRANEFDRLKQHDALIVMSFDPPDLIALIAT